MKPAARTVRVKLQREGAMCAIPVTFDPREVFGKLRAPVKVMLNGYSYRSTIFSMGGASFIPLRKSNREAAGLEGSETLRVTIALDLATREVAIPSDLARAMRAAPGTKARWDALSYTQRREFAEAIAGAKKPETRARRVAKALAVLKARR
jgi:hypothetical protein